MVCLNIVSSPGPDFVKVKARFSQVCQVVDQVIQVKDHVGQGQGQEHAKNISPLKPQNKGVLWGEFQKFITLGV